MRKKISSDCSLLPLHYPSKHFFVVFFHIARTDDPDLTAKLKNPGKESITWNYLDDCLEMLIIYNMC